MSSRYLLTKAARLTIGVLLAIPAPSAAQSSTATIYDSRMVTSFDQQVVPAPPTTTTTTPRHYRQGRFRVGAVPGLPPGDRVKLDVLGSGAAMCATEPLRSVHTRLVLRITVGPFTFTDVTADCPSQNIPAAAHYLYIDCGLTPTNADENMEATELAIVDAGSGLAIAVPGVRHP